MRFLSGIATSLIATFAALSRLMPHRSSCPGDKARSPMSSKFAMAGIGRLSSEIPPAVELPSCSLGRWPAPPVGGDCLNGAGQAGFRSAAGANLAESLRYVMRVIGNTSLHRNLPDCTARKCRPQWAVKEAGTPS